MKLKDVYNNAIVMQNNKDADIQALIRKIKGKNNNIEIESWYKWLQDGREVNLKSEGIVNATNDYAILKYYNDNVVTRGKN